MNLADLAARVGRQVAELGNERQEAFERSLAAARAKAQLLALQDSRRGDLARLDERLSSSRLASQTEELTRARAALAGRIQVLDETLLPEAELEIADADRKYQVAVCALDRAEADLALIKQAVPAALRAEAHLKDLAAALVGCDDVACGLLYRAAPDAVRRFAEAWPDEAAPLESVLAGFLEHFGKSAAGRAGAVTAIGVSPGA